MAAAAGYKRQAPGEVLRGSALIIHTRNKLKENAKLYIDALKKQNKQQQLFFVVCIGVPRKTEARGAYLRPL